MEEIPQQLYNLDNGSTEPMFNAHAYVPDKIDKQTKRVIEKNADAMSS